MDSRFKIVFSIPGRIRIRIAGLLRNDNAANEISSFVEEEDGVISVRLNIRTKNILICYNPETVDENRILAMLENIGRNVENGSDVNRSEAGFSLKDTFLVRNGPAYENERKLSVRLFKTVLLVGGITSAFHFMLRRLIAVLIFSCPVVLFAAPAATFYYAVRRSESRRIFIRRKEAIDLLENTESMYIHDSVFQLEEHNGRRLHQDYFNRGMRNFVFGIRVNGITDIAVLAEHNRQFGQSTAKQSGIREVYYLNNALEIRKYVHAHTLLVTAEDKPGLTDCSPEALVLCVYGDRYRELPSADIILQINDICKFPWLIGLSRYCREIIIRCQNTAITVNVIGVLAASFGYIGPLGALIAYGMNVAWQPIIIKGRILSYQKEIYDNGEFYQ